MYKKALSLMLTGALVVSLLAVDMSPQFSYAETIGDEGIATSSNGKRDDDKENGSDGEVWIASNSNASRKEQDEEDVTVATSSNATVATDSNATVATGSEAEQRIMDFSKVIKKTSLLKQEDYSVVSKENPIYSDESLVLRFEYKLKSSVKKDLSEGNDIVYEYQLPDDVLNLIGNYSALVGETFSDAPDSEALGYIGEFYGDGQIKITLLSADDVDDLDKYIDIPLAINCARENLPDKVSFMVGNIKRITVSLYWGFDYEETIDGITIHITASNGILPKNVEVRIIKVNQDNELEKVLRDSIEGFKKDETVAFDISFWDGNDEIQIENGKVNVSFICPKLSVDGETTVFHIDDDQNLELIPSRQESDGISFEADHFSVYGFTTTYTQDTDPLGNPLIGGTTAGDWKGNYIYFGWEGLESNKHSGNDNWLEIKDYVNDREFYRLNGQLYSGADLMTPIKWRILNNNGSALLLLADEMLDVYSYATAYNDPPTWETSDMRRWLNDEFMANHFTTEEQTDIKESTVTDIVNADSNLPEGNSTEDKIFLPSKEELTDEGYGFPINGESLSRKTAYNNDSLRSSNTASDRSYWTRSRGDLNYTLLRPVFVTEKGLCGYGANRYCSWILGVRPMLRLDLDSQRFGLNKTDSNLNAGIKFDKSALEMKVGDIKDLEVVPINIDDNLTNLKWISTDSSVISIGFDGKLSALSNGTANIYAIQGQYIAQCRITVKENPKQQYKVTFKDGDTVVREVMVEERTAAVAPILTKDGYILTWDKDFSAITEDIVINAIWTAKTYTIKYVLNGGTNHYLNPATYIVDGSGVVFQRPRFTGYVFEGWYTSSDFKTGTEIMLIAPNHTGDITVYAKWTLTNYKITYNLNGGTNSTLNPKTYKLGEEVVLKEPIRSGNVFKGWFTTPDFKAGTEISSISSGRTEDIIVYAKWELENTQGGGSHGSSGGGGGSISGSHSVGPNVGDKNDIYVNSVWEQTADGWKLKKKDGKFAIGWVYIDKKWYYFDDDGIMHTGWLDLSGKRYFLFEGTGSLEGAMVENEWCRIDSRYYYFNENGEFIRNLSNEEWIKEGYSKSSFFYQRDSGWVSKAKSIDSSVNPRVDQSCYLCVLSMLISNLGYTDVDPAILYFKNGKDTYIHQGTIKNNFNNELKDTQIDGMTDEEYRLVLYDLLTGGNETGKNGEHRVYNQGVVIRFGNGYQHYSLAVGAYRNSDGVIVIMVNDPGMEGEEHFIDLEESFVRKRAKLNVGMLEIWEKK